MGVIDKQLSELIDDDDEAPPELPPKKRITTKKDTDTTRVEHEEEEKEEEEEEERFVSVSLVSYFFSPFVTHRDLLNSFILVFLPSLVHFHLSSGDID